MHQIISLVAAAIHRDRLTGHSIITHFPAIFVGDSVKTIINELSVFEKDGHTHIVSIHAHELGTSYFATSFLVNHTL